MHSHRSQEQLTAAGRVAFVFLWLFVFSFPMEKAVMIPGLGSVSKVLGAAAFAAGISAVLIDTRVRVLGRAHAVLALMAVWIALTVRWSLDPEESVKELTTFVQLLGMVWLIWEFCPSQARVHSIARAYVLGTLVACFDTVSRWLMARDTYYQRYAATGSEPNDLALALAISVPLSYALAVRAKGVWAAVYWTQLGLAVLAVLLSASRSGFLCTLLALSVAVFTLRMVSPGQRKALCLAAAAAALMAVLFVPASSWKRISTIGSQVASGKLNMREVIWQAGWSALREHPVGGVGTGAFPRAVEPALGYPKGWTIVAHNTFLSVLVETGVVGFSLFAAFLAALLVSIARMQGIDRVAWAVVFAVWAVGASTLTWELRKPTWMIFALILAQARLARPAVRLAPPPVFRAGWLLRKQEVSLP